MSRTSVTRRSSRSLSRVQPQRAQHGSKYELPFSGDVCLRTIDHVVFSSICRPSACRTIGQFIKDLLSTNFSYNGTQLPRIPVPVHRDISKQVLLSLSSSSSSSSLLLLPPPPPLTVVPVPVLLLPLPLRPSWSALSALSVLSVSFLSFLSVVAVVILSPGISHHRFVVRS
eukprot:SAG11_NODE_3099_length_2694_cov_1.515607_2_plen_171_part_00